MIDRTGALALLARTATELRLGIASVRDLPSMARDLVSDGIDDPSVVALAAFDQHDDPSRSRERSSA